MAEREIATGVVHVVPSDLRKALLSDESALERWENLTPLARNEWICLGNLHKKTRDSKKYIERTITELLQGVRQPCCWAGCIHR